MRGICIAKADGSGRREITDGDCPSWSPDGTKLAFCLKAPRSAPPLIRVYDLQSKKEETLGIGWFRANWMPDSKSVVANGVLDRKFSMLRFWLDTPGLPSELITEYEDPTPHAAPGMGSCSSTSQRDPSPNLDGRWSNDRPVSSMIRHRKGTGSCFAQLLLQSSSAPGS